jgi:hypothetical protein
MAKRIIDAIRLALLRLVFPPSVLADIRIEAKLQQVSAIALIRSVLEKYLSTRRTISMRLGERTVRLKLDKVSLDQPLVDMTLDEQLDADEAMRIFREEDR